MQADDDRDIDPSQPLSLEDALLLGTRLHRLGQLDDAHTLYQAVLEAAPEQPDALQFLGILEHQRQRDELALSYMQRALAQVPNAPGLHQNLGNILLELERFDEAAAAYERCAELGGKTAELLNNIGVLRRGQRQPEAAEAAYRQALALNPDYIDAYNGYGYLLIQLERHKEAMQQFSHALVRDPANAGARRRLGMAFYMLGRFEEAAQVYRDWLDVEPGNPRAQHYLAACTGQEVPQRASDAYVESTFDLFAQSFDAKLQALDYRAPELIGQAVRRVAGTPQAKLDVLDAGCGTGLCEPMLAPFARKLVGVDLSGQMLEKAAQRSAHGGGYHELFKAELTAFIQAHPQSFDLIVSADTLCYFGALEAVCNAAYASLRPGGWLIFSVEALADTDASAQQGYKLQAHGRYSHARRYLQRVLEEAGFADVALDEAVLRTEGAEPVRGFVVVGRIKER